MSAKPFLPLPPGARLGVLGGGQLGAYFVRAAQSLGFRTAVLCPEADAPAMQCTDMAICADYTDIEALDALGHHCAGVTTEFENVPAEALTHLAMLTRVAPHAEAVAVAQNRILEKSHFQQLGLATTPFFAIHDEQDWARLIAQQHVEPLFPALFKTASMGYDGKGQWLVNNIDDAQVIWREQGCFVGVIEKRQTLIEELSVMVVRGSDGQCVCYPPVQNLHRQGILATTFAPAPNLTLAQQTLIMNTAKTLAESLDYVGVMGVEFFQTPEGLLLNEMAPRPHNSGHFTLSACVHSQFEQQVRVLAGWPLASTQMLEAAVMINILGDVWWAHENPTAQEPNWQAILALPQTDLFLYGKEEARRGRKMGHINVLQPLHSEGSLHFAALKKMTQHVAEILGIEHDFN